MTFAHGSQYKPGHQSRDGVEHGGGGDENRGLAHTSPEPARRHDNAFDFRHLRHAQDFVGVEILLLDPAAFERDLAIEQGGQPIGKRAFDLCHDLLRIDRMAGIGCRHDSMNFEFVVFWYSSSTFQ